MKKHLAAILYADVAGYSRLTQLDEKKTHRQLDWGLTQLSSDITYHDGRKIHEAGDAILAEFQSATAAVSCAITFQRKMALHNRHFPENKRFEFRIGVNLGEVIHDRDDIYGDGVNISARIQELAEPGGVCISGVAFEQVKGQIDHVFDDLGHQKVKNITEPIRVYAVRLYDRPSRTGHGPFFDKSAAAKPLTTGRCLCGEIRFEISAPAIDVTLCHCRMCQRFTGGQMAAGAWFPNEAVKFTRGEPKYFLTYYNSSPLAERGFCGNCGSGLSYRALVPQWSDWFYVFVSSLDNPQDFPPSWHLGVESQMPWADINDDLPRIRCEDSPALVAAWESVGVSSSDYPRNVNIRNKFGMSAVGPSPDK